MLKYALGSTLLVSAAQVMALTLGAAQGAAVIGRPMDVLVASSLDAADAAAGLCLEAEVMYGETRVPASAITVAIHRLGSDGSGALRVRATVPVNEPIVTVTLKAGCQNSFRRTYTLLADFEAAPVASPVATTSSRDVTAPNSAGRVAADTAGRSKAAERQSDVVVDPASQPARSASGSPEPVLNAQTPVRLSAPTPRPTGVVRMASKNRPAPRVAAGPVADAAAKQTVTAPGGSRLKLDPVELPANTGMPASAKPDDKQVPPPAGQDAAELLATGTQAASAAPAPDTGLQQELKNLRDEQQRLRMAVESVNAQLTQAQETRYSNPLTYGLGLAVLGLLGGVTYLLRREKANRAAADSWWHTTALPTGADPLAATSGFASSSTQAGAVDTDDALSGLEAVEAGASIFQEVPVTRVDAELLLDVWQQADFLQSIGQSYDAMHLLENFVQTHPRASEAPYLRWIQLAQQPGAEQSLNRAQSAYEHHFHRLLPPAQASVGSGLDGESAFLQQVSEAWPGPQAKTLIDAALFSQPGDPAGGLKDRSLRTFDDLLALRRLLQTLPTLPLEAPVAALPKEGGPSGAVAAALPVASEADAAEWLAVGDEVEPPPKMEPMLELDLSVPPAQPSHQAEAANTEAAKPDLPPLDFDFFDFDAEPGEGKKAP